MRNTALGLRSVFRAISSKSLLQQLFVRFAPSASVDWSAKAAELPDALFAACRSLRETNVGEHANLICALQEICDVSADRKSPERLVREIRDEGLIERFAKVVLGEGRHLQNCAAWLLLNAPEAWARLVLSAKAGAIHAKTIEEYATTPANTPDNTRLPLLRAAIATYLKTETLHGEHVHVETDEEGQRTRYLVSVNSFPNNVQQFDVRGQYAIARDANAINFMFEHEAESGTVRIKCPLTAPIRRELVRLFAEIVLGATVRSKCRTVYDLSRHLHERVLPLPNHPRIVGTRIVGVCVSFRNKANTLDTLCLTTLGPTNLNQRLQDCLSACGVSLEKVTVTDVEYRLTLRSKTNQQKAVKAHVTPDGFHFICRDQEERGIIINYLTQTIS